MAYWWYLQFDKYNFAREERTRVGAAMKKLTQLGEGAVQVSHGIADVSSVTRLFGKRFVGHLQYLLYV